MPVGTLVILKSGGPIMTLSHRYEDLWVCHWFVNNVLHEGKFLIESLVKVDLQ